MTRSLRTSAAVALSTLALLVSACSATPDNTPYYVCCNTSEPLPEGFEVTFESRPPVPSSPDPIRVYDLQDKRRDLLLSAEIAGLSAEPELSGVLKGFSITSRAEYRCRLRSETWGQKSSPVQIELEVWEAILIDSAVLICQGSLGRAVRVLIADVAALEGAPWEYR